MRYSELFLPALLASASLVNALPVADPDLTSTLNAGLKMGTSPKADAM